jgi:hypothetical protein
VKDFRKNKAISCLPNGAEILEIKDGERRKGSRNETGTFVVVYSLNGQKFRTSLSDQPNGEERKKR